MHTPPTPVRLSRRIARLATITLVGGGLAAQAAEPAATPPKTHRLFMGSNLSIVAKDFALPVKDVRQNSFVVLSAKGDLTIPAEDSQFQLKINDVLKLSSRLATVEKLDFERAYTPGNDPMKKFADAARVNAYMASNNDAADAALRQAQVGAGLSAGALSTANALAAANPTAAGGPLLVAQTTAQLAASNAQVDLAQQDTFQTQAMTGMDAFSTVSTSSRLNSDIGAEAFDAIRVTFQISSPRPLTTPYLVIFMRFMQEKDRPETAHVWVYAEKLPDIDERPRTITVFRGGFPRGYYIDSYHVHFYEGTNEIATTASRKRVDLTTAEAFQYSVIEYVGDHRNQTRNPVKATAFWPVDLSSRVLPDKLTRTLYVKVNKNGEALGLFEDEQCAKPVADTEITALVPELRFLPALDKGKPVEGVAAIKLG